MTELRRTPSGDQALIPLVSDLVGFLEKDQLSMSAVAERLGSAGQPDKLGQLEVQPRVPGVRAATVFSYPESGLPYLLSLEPEDDARPTPSALRAEFGDYRRMLTHFDQPRQLAFSTPRKPGGWHIALLVELAPTRDLDSAPITRITFRRDPP